MGTTLKISIYQTSELEASYGSKAINRAETWIKGAFSHTDNHSVNITKSSTLVGAPQQGPAGDSFSTNCMCTTEFVCDYNNLYDWWDTWLQEVGNCNSGPVEPDSNLLLTDYSSGGGLGGGNVAVACVGQEIAQLDSSHSLFGYQNRHNGMDTVLEELGHCFINWDEAIDCAHSDDDGDGRGHDSGVVQYDLEANRYGITPMGLTGDRCHNNCSDDSSLDTQSCFSKCDTDGDGDPDGWCLTYSTCTECGFVKK